jgi:hypothetical protein
MKSSHELHQLTVIRGLRGLRNIVCLSALLSSLGISRVRRVDVEEGEIVVAGHLTGEDARQAVAAAADLLDALRLESPGDAAQVCGEATRAGDAVTVVHRTRAPRTTA